MSFIEIVRLRQEYLDHLLLFFKEINFPEYRNDFSPHPFDAENAHRICTYRGRDLYYSMLLDNSQIIGYCMLRGWDEGYDTPSLGICVLKKYQRLGMGRLLMNFLEAVARLNGSVAILLKVKKDNMAAKNLYLTQKYIFSEYDENFLIGHKSLERIIKP